MEYQENESIKKPHFNVFLVLARLGRIFPAHSVFLSQLLAKTKLSAVEKELIVLPPI